MLRLNKALYLFINLINLLMATIKIWQKYVFGRLDENGNIEYFIPSSNRLVYKTVRNGRACTVYISNPTEAKMNEAGWYRVVNIEDDGTDYINDNILYHYIGVPTEEEFYDGEPTEPTEPTEGDGE